VPLFQTPPSLVVVWADGPLLVQRTVSPTLIVMALGEKAKSRMATSATLAALGLVDPPPHEASNALTPAVPTTVISDRMVYLLAPSQRSFFA
jgi:hypothetical protein